VGGKKNVCRVVVRKPVGNRTIVRPSCRWEDNNNKMGLRDVG